MTGVYNNPYQPNYTGYYRNNRFYVDPEQIKVTRELDGFNDTGVIGDFLTVGTQNLSDANRFFAMQRYRVSGLLADDNQVIPGVTVITNDHNRCILCGDDMYVAGDPLVGGKKNDYQPIEITPQTGFYTMLEDGIEGQRQVLVNTHVDTINGEGNTAFTEYGFTVTNENGEKTRATLSGGQLLIQNANGQMYKLTPGQEYIVGDPQDPVARFYYADMPGGENGTTENRLVFESYEKPSEDVVHHLMGKGATEADARSMRTRTQLTFGFRVPDGDGTYRMSEGTGAGPALKTTSNGVKTYYDAHFSEGACHMLDIRRCRLPGDDDPGDTGTDGDNYAYETPDYTGGRDGKIWGDPHFIAFDGGDYDVQGEHNKIYNILTDKDLQMNARFHVWPGNRTDLVDQGQPYATIMDRVGFTVGDDQVVYNPKSADAPTVNGQALVKGQTVSLDNGGSVVWNDDNTLQLTTSEYQVKLIGVNYGNETSAYINAEFKIAEGGPYTDFVAPHGLIGQTIDNDGLRRDGDRGRSVQGGGAIEYIDDQGNVVMSQRGNVTAHKSYEVGDLFGTNPNAAFNRYGAQVDTIVSADVDNDGLQDILEVRGADGTILFKNAKHKLEDFRDALVVAKVRQGNTELTPATTVQNVVGGPPIGTLAAAELLPETFALVNPNNAFALGGDNAVDDGVMETTTTNGTTTATNTADTDDVAEVQNTTLDPNSDEAIQQQLVQQQRYQWNHYQAYMQQVMQWFRQMMQRMFQNLFGGWFGGFRR